MDSLPGADWVLDYYSGLADEPASTAIYLNDAPSTGQKVETSFTDAITQANGIRKRDRDEPCVSQNSKASREKIRRDKMNERFSELSIILEPGKPAKTDKCAILNDAIRVLNELTAEAQELKEANKKLEEDIKVLKDEKHELREEKSQLRAEKERMEDRVKALSMPPTGYVPLPPAAFHPGVSKLMGFPSYGAVPMWQWIPPSARDTSNDHELRPPMA